MDLTTYKFPETKGYRIPDTDPVLLAEAEARGFQHMGNPYNKLFNAIFFRGGKVKFKEGVNPEFHKAAYGYFRALIGSFAPKHEHKEAVCAMLLSELCEPELEKENA